MKYADIKEHPLYSIGAMSQYALSSISKNLGISFKPDKFTLEKKFLHKNTKKYMSFSSNQNVHSGIYVQRQTQSSEDKKDNVVNFEVFFKFELNIVKNKLVPKSFKLKSEDSVLNSAIEAITPYILIADKLQYDTDKIWMVCYQGFLLESHNKNPFIYDYHESIKYRFMIENENINLNSNYYSFFDLSYMSNIHSIVSNFLNLSGIEITGMESIDELINIVDMVNI